MLGPAIGSQRLINKNSAALTPELTRLARMGFEVAQIVAQRRKGLCPLCVGSLSHFVAQAARRLIPHTSLYLGMQFLPSRWPYMKPFMARLFAFILIVLTISDAGAWSTR